MKRFVLLSFLLATLSISSSAQVVFNSAETLKRGGWSLGINPVIATEYDSDFALFIHGGYGLGSNSDLGLNLGVGWGDTYFGIDFEKSIIVGKPSISFGLGAHYHSNFGVDGSLLFTIPISNLRLTSGVDMDVIFVDNSNNDTDIFVPVWLPISLEFFVKRNLSITAEGNVKISKYAFTTFGGGISFYF